MKFTFKENFNENLTKVLVSLGNPRAHFTDHTAEATTSDEFSFTSLDVILTTGQSREKIKLLTHNPYGAFANYIDSNNLKNATEVVYAETIYPKALYTYLSGTRKRINFTNDFWRDDRDNRNKLNLNVSMGDVIESSSIWKLDAHIGFTEDTTHIPFQAGEADKDGTGELQNAHCLFHYGGGSSRILPALNYNRRIKLLYQDSSNLPSTRTGFASASANLLTYLSLQDY